MKDVPVLCGSVFRPREEKNKEGNIILGIRARAPPFSYGHKYARHEQEHLEMHNNRDRVIAQAGDCGRSKVVGRARYSKGGDGGQVRAGRVHLI